MSHGTEASAAFDRIMAALDAPMVIVTTADDRERAGCLVGFHAQSGMSPNELTVWLSRANHTFRVAVFADTLAVHFLTDSARHRELAALFGTVSGDDRDKFERCEWEPGPDGVPLLTGCPHRVVGRKRALLDTRSDHVSVVLEPVDATCDAPFEPLRLAAVVHLRPGHQAEERPQPPSTRDPSA